MTTSINCPHCNASLKLPDSVAGKTVKCPKCGESFQTPVAATVAVATAAPAATPGQPVAQAQPPAPAQLAAVQAAPVLTTPARQCVRCGYQGHMARKWASWVVPVAVVSAILTMGFGLLFLLVPKKPCCPQCSAVFE